MLTKAENERLTQVGPGTPGGELMRRYWHPIAPATQLREREVMPIRILGESLVLFCDKAGRVGLLEERCPHRQVKLECGYAHAGGIRCVYHGWTFDPSGQCVDQPAEPAGSTFKERVQIKAYPVQELAGLIFAYLGPQPVPALPRWDRLVWDNVYRVAGTATIPCNWLQCMENTPDPVHTEYLHGQYFKHWLEANDIPKDDPKWRLAEGFTTHFLKHEYELGRYGVDRRWLLEGQTGDSTIWKTSLPLVFPDIHLTSGGGRHNFGWRVPLDDTHTMEIFLRVFDPGPGAHVPRQEHIPYVEVPVVDRDGRFLRLDAITGQDVMAWSSQGAITDRSRESLGDSDRGVILFRRLIEMQIKRVEDGLDPINVFRDATEAECIELPVPWDRGYAWGYAKDGSYVRGSATAADMLTPGIVKEIEDLYEEAARNRKQPA
jgi:5,5'-dehydrodivanillate O-demethylase oxygenase subunit